jgi:predicted choloylglycine hydrolase
MSRGPFLIELRSQRSPKIAAALVIMLIAVIVVANLIAGVAALVFDAFVLACGIALYLTCDIITLPPYFRRKHRPVPFREAEAEGGRLEIGDGIPILILAGDNRRMGRQAGILLKEQLHVLIRDFLNYIFRNPRKKKMAMQRALSLEKHIPAQYLDELRGISETSGVPYEELLLANTFTEDYRLFLCSTLAARGKASAGGKMIMGRNMEFISVGVLQHYNMITIYHPDNGGAFAAMTYPGFIGAVTGMNARGLTTAMLISFSGGFSNERVPSTIAFRMLLERCATVDEAAKFIRENSIAGPFNLSMVDAEGGAKVVELASGHFETREPEDDVLTCTNRFYAGAHAGEKPDWRMRLLKHVAKNERGSLDVPAMRRALKMVYLFLVNLQSMVFLPEERVAHISFGDIPAAKGEFKRVDLGKYLG